MSKVTFVDIAKLAGVGTATVERVLNARGGVRPATTEKVILAARALNYPRLIPDEHRGIVRIEVILVRREMTFYTRLARAFERISATLDSSIQVQRTFMDELKPQEIADRILRRQPRRAGLILAVPDHPAIRRAISEAQASGQHVVQIVTRVGGIESDFVGIDNYGAGRMAALLLSKIQTLKGTVVALTHSHMYQVHRDRIWGFSDYFAQMKPEGKDFAHVLYGFDDVGLIFDRTYEALSKWPDLVGIYNVGGANGAVLSVLRKHPRGKHVSFVGHELTENTEAALRDGSMSVVLDQMPEAQARRSIDMVLSRLGLLAVPVEQSPIRFVTITPENI